MGTKSKQRKGLDGALSSLDAAIDTLDLATDATSVKPAKDAFRSTSNLLTEIRVRLLLADIYRLLTNVRRIR